MKKSELTELIRCIVKKVVKEIKVKEDSISAAASPVTGPNAFKKKPMEGLEPLGGMEESKNQCRIKGCSGKVCPDTRVGLQGLCKAHIDSQRDQEKRTGAYQSTIRAIHKDKEEQLDEITTTMGGTPGYNIPGAFSRRGGSKKGIAGSAALGYTLTSTGKKDMNLKADKLYEGMKEIKI